jgi:hypothetical protein
MDGVANTLLEGHIPVFVTMALKYPLKLKFCLSRTKESDLHFLLGPDKSLDDQCNEHVLIEPRPPE